MTSEAGALSTLPASAKRAIAAWCAFDWANSAYPTVIATFVFGAYVTKAVAETPEAGTSAWGYAMGLSGFLVAVLAPLVGAAADGGGRKKPWLAVFSGLCMLATALLWFVEPHPSWLLFALVLVVISNTAFETSTVFYNALLPEIAPERHIGRISGWAWGVGYAGGLACLVTALFVFIQADPPPFGLDGGDDAQEPVRATALLVTLWYAAFCLPLFLLVPDGRRVGALAMTEPAPPGPSVFELVVNGVQRLMQTLKNIRQHKTIAWFLFARMLYIDGLNTVFAFGGIYAAGTFGMSFSEIILFGILMNVAAGGGAVAFAWVDDSLGSRTTILIGLVGLILCGLVVLLAPTVLWFWIGALTMGVFFGPVQASSRTLMARLAPADLRGEMFGLFALSGRITAFLGPVLLAIVTDVMDSQRWGMASVLLFLVPGCLLLWWKVRPEADAVPASVR